MGLEEIVENIRSETETRVKRIIGAAKEEADKIIGATEVEAKAYLQREKENSEIEAKQLILRELSRANIEAKATLQESADSAIKKSIGLVNDQIDAYFETPAYAKLLNRLAQAARTELGDGCVLFLQERDLQKVKKAPEGAHIESSGEKFSGGLKGISKNNDMFVDYSMESIMKMLNDRMAVGIQNEIMG
jgi:vacuolar-type H+-ATPase subunit E/Vma4